MGVVVGQERELFNSLLKNEEIACVYVDEYDILDQGRLVMQESERIAVGKRRWDVIYHWRGSLYLEAQTALPQ